MKTTQFLIAVLFLSLVAFIPLDIQAKNFFKQVGDTVYKPVKSAGHAIGIEGHKTFSICGVNLRVPTIMYAVCYVSAVTLPADCTVGSATTGGGACAAAIAVVASSCGISIAASTEIAKSCIGEL